MNAMIWQTLWSVVRDEAEHARKATCDTIIQNQTKTWRSVVSGEAKRMQTATYGAIIQKQMNKNQDRGGGGYDEENDDALVRKVRKELYPLLTTQVMLHSDLIVRCLSSRQHEGVLDEDDDAPQVYILNCSNQGAVFSELYAPWFSILIDMDAVVAQDVHVPTWVITPEWITAHQIFMWWYRWKLDNESACKAFGAYDEAMAPSDEAFATSVIEDDDPALAHARTAFETVFEQLLRIEADLTHSDKLVSISCFYGFGKRFVMFRFPRSWVSDGLVSSRIVFTSHRESCLDGEMVGRVWERVCKSATSILATQKAHMICIRTYAATALLSHLHAFESREHTKCIFSAKSLL